MFHPQAEGAVRSLRVISSTIPFPIRRAVRAGEDGYPLFNGSIESEGMGISGFSFPVPSTV